ncbi:hypothetical protein ABW20_dc0101901 [Dactylellina cionopaga]|nr:hypothetical protein ABW20_dc0101901 [Dactylellina cionopaga]
MSASVTLLGQRDSNLYPQYSPNQRTTTQKLQTIPSVLKNVVHAGSWANAGQTVYPPTLEITADGDDDADLQIHLPPISGPDSQFLPIDRYINETLKDQPWHSLGLGTAVPSNILAEQMDALLEKI